jgi:hypothetical protein
MINSRRPRASARQPWQNAAAVRLDAKGRGRLGVGLASDDLGEALAHNTVVTPAPA